MNDICRDTAIIRMSDAAGFEAEEQKKQRDTAWLNQIVDETTTMDDLAEILERGFYACRFDDDGDIVVRDLINFYIHPAMEGLLLTAIFDFREGVDREAMHAVTRAVNAGEWMVRYRVSGDEQPFLRAEHYIVLRGGITARNFGHTLRRYVTAVFHQVRGEHREVFV